MYKTLDKLSKFFYLGATIPLFLALLTPLLLNSRFLFPFITTKVLFFRILIEIALFFYILLEIRKPEFRPKLTALSIAILVFTGIATLAALFGVNLYRSFWGNIERGEGLLMFYHVIVFFLLAVWLLKSRKIWLAFLNTSILVTVAASFYALSQKLALDFVIHSGAGRLNATIGNASFFAGFLLFSIFFSIWFFIKSRAPWARIIYGLVIVFEVWMLIETQTRGAFLGLVIGLFIFAGLYLFFNRGQHRKVARLSAAFMVFLVMAGGLVWFSRDSQAVSSVAILKRLTTISLNDITTQSRLLAWDSSWQGLKDRPLLGYGWENYNVAFNKYFHAEIFHDSGSQIWFDRAHNIVFDIAVNNGLLGFASYLAIFVMAILVLVRYYRKTQDTATAAVLFSLLAAYFIQNLFVFDVLATYISFYTLLGYIVFLELFQRGEEKKSADKALPVWALPAGAALALVGLVVSIYYFNILPGRANITAVKALIAQNLNRPSEAAGLFKEAINLKTNQSPEIRQKYAEFVLGLSNASNVDRQFLNNEFNYVINELKANIKSSPLDVQYHMFLMILYNRSSHIDPRRLDLVLETGKRALELSPTRPQTYYEIGQAHISKREFTSGIAAFAKAVELQPRALESRWNLAAAYIIAGEMEQAQEQFAELEKQGFDYYSNTNLKRMISVFSNAQNWAELANIYEALMEQEPQNPEWHAQIAPVYQKLGEYDKARAAAQRAAELQPALAPNVKVFLEELDRLQGITAQDEASAEVLEVE